MTSSTRHSYTLYIGSADGIIWTRSYWQDMSPSLYVEIKAEWSAAQRTTVINQDKAPAWNENFLLIGNMSSIVSLSVKHSTWLFGKDPCIGRIDIRIETLLAHCIGDQCTILRLKSNASDGGDRSTGEIVVKLTRLVDADNFVGVGEELIDDLFKLGVNQLTRFKRLGQLTDIEDSILNLQKAVQFTKDGHPKQSMNLVNLGVSQMKRYERLGRLIDINDSISNFQKAVQFTEDEDSRKLMMLSGLGLSHQRRFERLGRLTDLEDSISNLHNAVRLTYDGDPDKATHFSGLGLSQKLRFRRFGQLTDLEHSILNLHKAVQLSNVGNEALHLSNLGVSQQLRFEHLGELIDIEHCVSTLQQAVQLTEDKHQQKPVYLCNLGSSQRDRFERLGGLIDIEDSISNLQKSVHLTKDGDPGEATHFSALGLSQRRRFERLGQPTDLEDSISNLQKAVQLTEHGHADKPVHLANLGSVQRDRFDCFGQLTDLECSILNLQNAVQLTYDGDPYEAECLSTLGLSQQVLFERLGQLTDLQHSISNMQKAVQLTDDRHPGKAIYLSNLGLSQRLRFERLGELTDIENSISNLQKAVQFTGDGDPRKGIHLSNLGLSQGLRFEHLGQLTDLELSISNMYKAVQITDDGHPIKRRCLCNLGLGQLVRFERLGELDDIEHCISNLQKVVRFAEDEHPDKVIYFSQLGYSHLRRYGRLGGVDDVEDSIYNLQQAVQLSYDGDPHKASHLSNLGLAQRTRFDCLGQLTDIENSILNLQKSVHFTEDSHPHKPTYLNNLGWSHLRRLKHLGQLPDLENAISHFRKAVGLTTQHHSAKVKLLFGLATAQQLRFERLGHLADCVAAIATFKAAAQSNTAYPRDSLLAARNWADLSYRRGDVSSALNGYRIALEVLPKVAWLGLSTVSRQRWLVHDDFENLSCLSATCAIQLGCFEEAVELLDLGRSVLWQQASYLRTDLEELREVKPELANRLESIGQQLDAGNFSDLLLPVNKQQIRATKDVVEQHRHLVGEWESLLENIRHLPQFAHFLKPLPFCQLRQAASGGQIIIINISQYGVDALIFDATHQIHHVPLPNADLQTLFRLGHDIVLQHPLNPSAVQRKGYNTRYLKPALRKVWNDIVIPVFNKIHIHSDDNSGTPQRHIWWYPTGPLTFIPIHAAGPGKGDIDVSHLVISSYVTTLSSLLQAQKKMEQSVMRRPKLLAVSQPDTPGQEFIPLAQEEVDKVVEVACLAGWPGDDIIHLSGLDATVHGVLGALESSSWVHLSCHGMQHPTSGMDSAFALHDGNLKLSQLVSQNRSFRQFAFLSACHTATGLRNLPGEAMHLAGGLQFAGFPSVIATMWGIHDKDAPIVASHTYEYLFRHGLQEHDPLEGAVALNIAVLRLREDPDVTVDRWAPFIHFGI